jgi:hypothetical protein
MSYTGRCACGDVAIDVTGEPIQTRQCWCRQCQRIAAGGPTHNAIFRADDVAVDGPLATDRYIAASGNTLTKWFCLTCGSHIYAQSSARSELKTVRLGVLDEPHGLRPQMAIWTDDAPEWAMIDPAMERYPQQPPPPGKASNA